MKTAENKPHTILISDVLVGTRHRHDLGDIDELSRSIAQVGLLHPIVVRSDGTLIAGTRRLAACQHLGWQEIPVTVIDLDEIARGEFAENAYRKSFTPSEIYEIWRALEPIERAAAQERQKATRFGSGGGKFPPPSKGGKTRDKVAAFGGVSGRTFDKISAVMQAAEADPQYVPFAEKMDRTRQVDGVFRELRTAQQAERLRQEPPPLPRQGPYRVIAADPAWRFDTRSGDPSHRGTTPYPTMTTDEIAALPVADIAHPDCVLFLWTTNAHLLSGDAFRVIKAWSFEPRTMLTWAKDKIGCGNWLRGQTEHCILATRGKPLIQLTNQSTLLSAPSGRHSEKPAVFYDVVESLCPTSRYLSLFHRGPSRPNWDGYGDEADQTGSRSGMLAHHDQIFTPKCIFWLGYQKL